MESDEKLADNLLEIYFPGIIQNRNLRKFISDFNDYESGHLQTFS